jgi:hypothetical protein
MIGVRNSYKNLVGKPEKKRPLGRPMRRWKDYIITFLLKKYEVKTEDCFEVNQGMVQRRAFVRTVTNHRDPQMNVIS